MSENDSKVDPAIEAAALVASAIFHLDIEDRERSRGNAQTIVDFAHLLLDEWRARDSKNEGGR